MAYESITDVNLTKGIDQPLNYVNRISDGNFIIWLLISIYAIVFFAVYRLERDFAECASAAGILTFFVSVLLWAGDLLTTQYLIIVMGINLVSFISLWISKKTSS